MRIGLVTKGSRGDIQPFIALALGLKTRGHSVSIVTFKNFRDLVSDYGIDFIPLDMDMENEIYTEEIMEVLRNGNMLKFAQLVGRHSAKHNEKTILEVNKAADDFDFIVSSGLAFPTILPITKKNNIGYAILNFSMPYSLTREFPAMGFGFQNIPFLNRLSYYVFNYFAIKLVIQKEANQTASLLNLPKWTTSQLRKVLMRSNQLIIHPMSKHLLPPPADWPTNSVVTGFLALPADLRNSNPNELISKDLEAWLERGEAPIYIGFGSIPVPDTALLKSIIQQLLLQTNHRIIYCLGWTKPFLDIEHDNLFIIDKINHDWLFPRCKLAIIHGGIGTIGAALKAQLPLIIASIVVDQPFNGQMIEKLNVGIHFPFRKLSFDKLISAIDRILDGNYRINAKLIGEKMRLENGVGESVEIIENYIAKI